MDQRQVAYAALRRAWEPVSALVFAGRITPREAERTKEELDLVAAALAADYLEVQAMEFRSCAPRARPLSGVEKGTPAQSRAEGVRADGRVRVVGDVKRLQGIPPDPVASDGGRRTVGDADAVG